MRLASNLSLSLGLDAAREVARQTCSSTFDVSCRHRDSGRLDVENPEPVHYGEKLVKAVESGQVAPDIIETACRRILRIIYRFACAEDPLPDYTTDMVASAPNIAVALEAAER